MTKFLDSELYIEIVYLFFLLPSIMSYIFDQRVFCFSSSIRDCLVGAGRIALSWLFFKDIAIYKNINLLLEISETFNYVVSLRNGVLHYFNFRIHVPWNFLNLFNRIQYRGVLIKYYFSRGISCLILRRDRLIYIHII